MLASPNLAHEDKLARAVVRVLAANEKATDVNQSPLARAECRRRTYGPVEACSLALGTRWRRAAAAARTCYPRFQSAAAQSKAEDRALRKASSLHENSENTQEIQEWRAAARLPVPCS